MNPSTHLMFAPATQHLEFLLASILYTPSICTVLLRCFGYMDHSLLNDCVMQAMARTLAASSIEVREATIRALENLGTPKAIVFRG